MEVDKKNQLIETFRKLEMKVRNTGEPDLILELDRICEYRTEEELPQAIQLMRGIVSMIKSEQQVA